MFIPDELMNDYTLALRPVMRIIAHTKHNQQVQMLYTVPPTIPNQHPLMMMMIDTITIMLGEDYATMATMMTARTGTTSEIFTARMMTDTEKKALGLASSPHYKLS